MDCSIITITFFTIYIFSITITYLFDEMRLSEIPFKEMSFRNETSLDTNMLNEMSPNQNY